jgi:parallel beta-helix repeat protein
MTAAALLLGGVLACNTEAPTRPQAAAALAASRAADVQHTLVVDDDRVDCPNADFQSIQAAVDAAEPGSTILVCAGTYREWVVITKDDLRLLAKGQPGDVVLDGQDLPGTACAPASTIAVHCAGFELRNAHDNLIEGFVVKRYWEAGIWLRLGSSNNTIRKNVTTESPHHDGIQVANGVANIIEQNISFANVTPHNNACGVNITGAASDGNIVRNNEVYTNDFGIQAAGGALNTVIFQNESHDNRHFGIRNVAGASGTMIEENHSLTNTGPGIALLASNGVTVARNKAFDNAPDLFWDGLGANQFENNHCRSSVPPGLCEHEEGASTK